MIYRNLRTAQTIDTPLEPRQIIEIVSSLPCATEPFYASLLKQHEETKCLSQTQMFFLAKQALSVDNSVALKEGAFKRIAELLTGATIKNARIRIKTPAGTVCWYLRDERVRVFVGSQLVGVIKPDDKFVFQSITPRVVELTKVLAIDPLAACMLWGVETGTCCFCFRELTDERSVSVGYGPICAEKWDLPWGA